jgi:hypothetical protein
MMLGIDLTWLLCHPKWSGRKFCNCGKRVTCPTEGQFHDKRKTGRRKRLNSLPSRTSRWYACQFHRTCRSSDLYVCVRRRAMNMSLMRGVLTGGGGLAGIDVADNDHVDVHLFLTAERPEVSKQSIKIRSRCEMMLLMSRCKKGGVVVVDGLF